MVSMMTFESTFEATWKAMRVGKLALIRPVITLTEGLWVASTIWMPAALPIWARRMIGSSTSLRHDIMRSASSSMMTTRYGSRAGSFSSGSLSSRSIFLLYPFMFLTSASEKYSYLFSISRTIQFIPAAAFLCSLTMGAIRWGRSLYWLISTLFGSTRKSLTTSGGQA